MIPFILNAVFVTLDFAVSRQCAITFSRRVEHLKALHIVHMHLNKDEWVCVVYVNVYYRSALEPILLEVMYGLPLWATKTNRFGWGCVALNSLTLSPTNPSLSE